MTDDVRFEFAVRRAYEDLCTERPDACLLVILIINQYFHTDAETLMMQVGMAYPRMPLADVLAVMESVHSHLRRNLDMFDQFIRISADFEDVLRPNNRSDDAWPIK